jgi:dTDP-4-amino-4,6-dideoxygalactose transaminase
MTTLDSSRPARAAAPAVLGGPRCVPSQLDDEHGPGTRWPVITAADEAAVSRVLRRGLLVSTADGEPEVTGLEQEWARFTGAPHCLGVASGTAALQLALTALDVGPGDEVVVPALSMNATALAVVATGARPMFVDIDPATFTMDPRGLVDAITPRTRAVLPVHLHGLPADMDRIGAVAHAHGLPVVEDAAQAHGATVDGRAVGTLGAFGCFSLHPSKNLPTCGEGGLLTATTEDGYERARRLRTFGERTGPGAARSYVAHEAGGNQKLSPVQAAFARSQLHRFAEYHRLREPGILEFLRRLAALPGLRVPAVPAGRTHRWHILRIRLVPDELGLDDLDPAVVRHAVHRALRAEGVPLSRYQVLPLPAHPAFGTRTAPVADEFPVTTAVLADSLCLQRRQLNPGSAPALAAYADAVEKVWEQLDVVRGLARAAAARTGGAR